MALQIRAESATELQAEPDAKWTTISVPHTWNRVGYYKDAPASHVATAQIVVTTQGVGWYKLVFTPPANVSGMESFLQFDAASRMVESWHRIAGGRIFLAVALFFCVPLT